MLAWYHPEGVDPQWVTPIIPEYDVGDHLVVDHAERIVQTSWQEVSENGIDIAHFPIVHGTCEIQSFTVTSKGPTRHVVRRQKVSTPAGPVDSLIESEEFGPGVGVVRFSVEFEHIEAMQFCILTGITPIDSNSLMMRFTLLVRPSEEIRRVRILGRLLLRDLMRQVEQDVIIWEHKRYAERPCLVKGDGPIVEHRLWAKQFYVSAPST